MSFKAVFERCGTGFTVFSGGRARRRQGSISGSAPGKRLNLS